MEQIINSWVKINFNAWMLAVEASMAVPMRAMRILAGGPGGKAELRRVIDESKQAAATLPAPAQAGMRLIESGLEGADKAARAIEADSRDLANGRPATRTPKVARKAARKATRLAAKAPKQAEKAIKTQRRKVKATTRRPARSGARA
jgi:hypothetical protein